MFLAGPNWSFRFNLVEHLGPATNQIFNQLMTKPPTILLL